MTTPENTLRVGITDPNPSFRGAFANRDFSFLFIGQLGSEIGNGAVQLALPWLVLKLTDSAFQLGFAYFFQFSPMLLFGILGGVFVDRWDRRLTIVIVDLVRGIAFMSVAVIYYVGSLTVEHIYAVIFLESSLANFFNPARAALMPNLVDKEHLRSANSLMEVARNVGFLVAPPVGAAVAEILGPSSIMLIDGVTFLLSAVTVFLIKWRQPARQLTQAEGKLHALRIVIDETKAGLKVIMRARLLQVSVLLGFVLNLVVAPIQVLIPLFVRDIKHAAVGYFGVMVAGLLVGLLVGSLTAPQTARRIGLGPMAIGAVSLLGVIISIAAWPPGLWPPVLAMFIAGTAVGSLNVAQITLIQGSTSDDERGRVSATYYTATLGVRPLGFLAMGALASAVDIRFLFVSLGALALLVGIVLAQIREVREHR
jgi:DHA3 family macrolide efflux protein-like MFS transporter